MNPSSLSSASLNLHSDERDRNTIKINIILQLLPNLWEIFPILDNQIEADYS